MQTFALRCMLNQKKKFIFNAQETIDMAEEHFNTSRIIENTKKYKYAN